MADYARLNVGDSLQGLQIWCMRHGCNVMHIDFQGQTHPAIMWREEEKCARDVEHL